MLVTQWFCRKCKRIIANAEVSETRRHYKNDCNGECFIITANDIVENPTQKKFRELVNAIPMHTSIIEDIRTEIELLPRYMFVVNAGVFFSDTGPYLKYEDVMKILKEQKNNAKKEK